MATKKALGKGLDALIKRPASRGLKVEQRGRGEVVHEGIGAEPVRRVPLDRIVPSPFQPRSVFREDQLEELIESIRQHGVIQPLIVRGVGEHLELIAGERRWRACSKAGLEDVPVIVREATDRDALEMALIENLQREDLNPIEEAEAYVRLAREFDLTQEQIARRVGKNRATVANAMRLLDLEKEVQSHLAQGLISPGHAKVLLGEKEAERQLLLAEQVVKKSLTVRQLEALMEKARRGDGTGGSRRSSSGRTIDPEVAAALESVTRGLRDRLGTRVAVNHRGEKGTIEIEYYGHEDLDRILGLMGVSLGEDEF